VKKDSAMACGPVCGCGDTSKTFIKEIGAERKIIPQRLVVLGALPVEQRRDVRCSTTELVHRHRRRVERKRCVAVSPAQFFLCLVLRSQIGLPTSGHPRAMVV